MRKTLGTGTSGNKVRTKEVRALLHIRAHKKQVATLKQIANSATVETKRANGRAAEARTAITGLLTVAIQSGGHFRLETSNGPPQFALKECGPVPLWDRAEHRLRLTVRIGRGRDMCYEAALNEWALEDSREGACVYVQRVLEHTVREIANSVL